MAEWLGSGLQIPLRRFDSGSYLQCAPSKFLVIMKIINIVISRSMLDIAQASGVCWYPK